MATRLPEKVADNELFQMEQAALAVLRQFFEMTSLRGQVLTPEMFVSDDCREQYDVALELNRAGLLWRFYRKRGDQQVYWQALTDTSLETYRNVVQDGIDWIVPETTTYSFPGEKHATSRHLAALVVRVLRDQIVFGGVGADENERLTVIDPVEVDR